MTFAWPLVFLGLIPLLWWWWRTLRASRRQAVSYPSIHAVAGAGSTLRQRLLWMSPIMYMLATLALLIALARPQQFQMETKEVHQGIAIEMLIDISSSMDMGTIGASSGTTRLEAAKTVLEDFVVGDGKDLGGRPHDLVGIVTFARYADTACPLTLSHDAVAFITRDIQVQDLPLEDGTAFGDAVALAAAQLKLYQPAGREGRPSAPDTDIRSKIIVLLTDGENNCGEHLPIQAAAMAREWGIRVYTIHFGDPPEPQSLRTGQGALVRSEGLSATEVSLRHMADTTGGIFRHATDEDSLRAVYAEIDKLEKSELKPIVFRRKQERFALFGLLTLGLLSVNILLDATVLRCAP